MCNTHYFSTAKMVTRTRLIVTLCVHCLSCFIIFENCSVHLWHPSTKIFLTAGFLKVLFDIRTLRTRIFSSDANQFYFQRTFYCIPQGVKLHHTIFAPHTWLGITHRTHFKQSNSPEEVPIWSLAGHLLTLSLANKSNLVHNSAQYIYFPSLHVSGKHVPFIRRNYCIYAILVFVTVWIASGLLVGVNSNQHMVARNMQRREINILSRIVHLVGFICKIKILDVKPEKLLVTHTHTHTHARTRTKAVGFKLGGNIIQNFKYVAFSDYAAGKTVRGAYPGMCKGLQSSPKRPYWLLDTPSLFADGYWGHVPRGSYSWGVKMNTHHHLVSRFRMSGALPPFSHIGTASSS